ncbi:CPBP family intramembrane metalloprotease [Amycolatopsis ultiminotia]|uniref:CPBP family intramembrane metalloprotease n=1 Tax=Amycolatopsis ultiminotia TaxID=543629 RepID=A0ABP6YHK2_9PSEU
MSTGSPIPVRYRTDLILFFALAFGLSWAAWLITAGIGRPPTPGSAAFLPYVFGAFGPLLAGAVVRIRRAVRKEPAPGHAIRFRPGSLLWALALLVLASAIVLASAFLAHIAGGGPAPSLDFAATVIKQNPLGPVAFFATMLITGPLSEEPGWRGTAYPRMRASAGRYRVSVLIGVIWAIWHLPLFFVTGTVQNQLGLATPSGVLFTVSAIPMAMLVCYAYERAGVLAAIAVHFATNTTMVLLGVSAPVVQAMILGIQALVAIALLGAVRPGRRTTPAAVVSRPQS